MLIPVDIIKQIVNGVAVGASLYKLVKGISRENNMDNLNSLYKDVIIGKSRKGN